MATLVLSLLLLFRLLSVTDSATTPPPSSFVVSSCSGAHNPSLCVRTLSPSSPRTSAQLALTAVSASLSAARDATSYLRHMTSATQGPVKDCVSQLSDSSDQLARTAAELGRLRPETFRWQLDNAQTWVSAALTNQDMCIDAVRGLAGSTRNPVTAKVSDVSQVTSNALYLVSRLASSRGRNR